MIKTLNATTLMTVGRCYTTDATSDSPEPKDNQYYAWIQDLVSGNRTTSGSPKSYAAVALRAWATRRTYRIKASARQL